MNMNSLSLLQGTHGIMGNCCGWMHFSISGPVCWYSVWSYPWSHVSRPGWNGGSSKKRYTPRTEASRCVTCVYHLNLWNVSGIRICISLTMKGNSDNNPGPGLLLKYTADRWWLSSLVAFFCLIWIGILRQHHRSVFSIQSKYLLDDLMVICSILYGCMSVCKFMHLRKFQNATNKICMFGVILSCSVTPFIVGTLSPSDTTFLLSLAVGFLFILFSAVKKKSHWQCFTAAIFPVVKKQHQLLVTLLLCNALAMEVKFHSRIWTLHFIKTIIPCVKMGSIYRHFPYFWITYSTKWLQSFYLLRSFWYSGRYCIQITFSR